MDGKEHIETTEARMVESVTTTLAASVIAAVAPYLVEAGKKIVSDTAWEGAKSKGLNV